MTCDPGGGPSTACSTPSRFAPPACLGGGFLEAGWEDVKVALEVSAYSLKVLAAGFRPLLQAAGGGSVVASRLRRHGGLARLRLDGRGQGRPRIHGPLPGPGSRSRRHPGQPGRGRSDQDHGGEVHSRVLTASRTCGTSGPPSGWSVTDPEPVARACVALLSDWFPATTGEMVHVDGGFHAMGV